MKQNKEDVIEMLQEQIVNSGGRFFKRRELECLSLGDILDTILCNGIEVNFCASSKKGKPKTSSHRDMKEFTSLEEDRDVGIFE